MFVVNIYPYMIKIAVVGIGRIGWRHVKMIELNPSTELVAIIDTDQKVISHFEAFNPGIPAFNGLNDFYNSNVECDVLSICTPNYLHASQSLSALSNGHHIIVEKPFTLNKKEAEQVIQLSQEHEKLVFCVMQNRYSPPSQWLKEITESGKLGEIYAVHINCFWNRDASYYQEGNTQFWKGKQEQDGGTLFTQFSHFIDMMYWLFGDITNISARFYDFNHQKLTDFEDSGFIHFDFVNGGHGTFNYTTATYEKNLESSITIIAEHGSIKVGGQYMNKVEYCNIQDYEMPTLESTLPPNDYGNFQGSAANHQFVYQNLVDTLKHKNDITTNSLEGLKVVEIIENIYRLK